MDHSLTAAPPPSAALSPRLVAAALALLLGLQPLSTDLYLPALPSLARELQAPMAAAQLTMSALILAFGVAQLVWGPVADRFGRRPVLLCGLSLYTLAGALCTIAPDIQLLVLGRTLQGAALAAAVVCGRATIRDLYEPQQGAHVMSQAMSGLGLIAVLAPVIGGTLAGWWGWRAALASLAAIGAGVLAFVALSLPETVRQRNPRALHLAPLLGQASQVLRHPTFIAWTALTSSTYGGLFTVLAGSSFVYIGVLGLSPGRYGMAMASGALSYLLGTFVCRRWLRRVGLRGAVRLGALFTLAGGVSMSALAWCGVQSVWAVLVPQWLYVLGHGVHQPCGQTGAVSAFPQAAGVAAALAGFVLAVVAFGVGLWLGHALDGTVRPMVYGVGAWSVITATVAWTLVQRHGELTPRA
jgi:DHA1 family bicyclomycin/chloramphenicol resistance-like MFS transporter